MINIPEIHKLISHFGNQLKIESILCYGSYAAGLQDDKSDIDLLILTNKLPQVSQLQKIYQSLPDVTHFEFIDLAHWDNSWSLLNSSLSINGIKFDIGFNSTSWVKTIVENLIGKNEISFKEFPFRPYTFLGLLENSLCLYDKNLFISKLKSKIRPFPIALKKAIIKSTLPMLQSSYDDLIDNIERDLGILTYQFHIFMGVDAMCELLWVINDTYDPASKRAEHYLFKLKNLPENFVELITVQLPQSYTQKQQFIVAIGKAKKYIEDKIVELNLV